MLESLNLSVEITPDGKLVVLVEETSSSISPDIWILRVVNSDGDLARGPFQADGKSSCIELPGPVFQLSVKTLHSVVVEGARKVSTAENDDSRSSFVIISHGRTSLQSVIGDQRCGHHEVTDDLRPRSLTEVNLALKVDQATISGRTEIVVDSTGSPDLWQIRLRKQTVFLQSSGLVEVFHFDGSISRFEIPVSLEPEVDYQVEARGLIRVGRGPTKEGHLEACFLIVCVASTSFTVRPLSTTLEKFEVELTLEQTTYREADVLIQNRSDRNPEFWVLSINGADSYTIPGDETRFRIPGWFDSGPTYLLSLRGMLEVKGESSRTEAYLVAWQKELRFRPELTVVDIRSLLSKAVNMAIDGVSPSRGSPAIAKRCVWLYRNKPPDYFVDIYGKRGGIMQVRPKDNNGDPGSPINGGRLKGLFFMASVDRISSTGAPIPVSPYGSTRICIEAERLVNESGNIYFTDFYCMNSMKVDSYHYVTLVVTKPSSEADLFCSTRLVKLSLSDQSENPFLFVDQSNRLYVTARLRLLVEVFYTEDLDIREYEARLMHSVPEVGSANIGRGGIRKNQLCTICNLYPRRDLD